MAAYHAAMRGAAKRYNKLVQQLASVGGDSLTSILPLSKATSNRLLGIIDKYSVLSLEKRVKDC